MKWFTGLLLLFNVTLLYFIYSGNTHAVDERRDIGLTLLSGDEPEKTPFTLYIFFHSDGDCACLEDWPNWVDLANEHKDIMQVKGVFNGSDEGKFIDFGRGLDLPFPLYRDAGTLRRELGVMPEKVVKVLVAPSGHVLFTDTDQAKPQDHVHFMQRVRAHLHEYQSFVDQS